MKRRELSYLVSGLIVGLILGILLQEAVLGGTAGTRSKAVSYYVVELGTTEEWLVQTYPGNGEKVQTAMRVVSPSESTVPPDTHFGAVAEDADFLLQQTYGALTGEEDAANLKVKDDSDTMLCLAVDDKPDEDAIVYLYLIVPADEAKNLDIPEAWEKLTKPKTNDLYWQIVACFPEEVE